MKCIITVLLTSIIFCQLVKAQGCKTVIRRRDIRKMNQTERQRYFNAIHALHRKRTIGGSEYDRFVAIHINLSDLIHDNALFLPWHRMFVRQFELALQKIDPGVTVPYWDWTRDSQRPEQSFMFRSDMYGGNGRPYDGRVVDGQFANWWVTTSDDLDDDDQPFFEAHYLERQWVKNDQIGAFYNYLQMEAILERSTDYKQFYYYLQDAPHALVHDNIGNTTKDMSSQASPNDPIFWAHHAFVDLIWHEWQRRHPHLANTYNEFDKLLSERSKLTYVMRPFNVTVADVLDTKSKHLCYDYPKWVPREHAKEKQLKKNAPARTGTTQYPQQIVAQGRSIGPSSPLISPTTSGKASDQANQSGETEPRGIFANAFMERFKHIGTFVNNFLTKLDPSLKGKNQPAAKFATVAVRAAARAIEMVEYLTDLIIKGTFNLASYAGYFAKYNPPVDTYDKTSTKLRNSKQVSVKFLKRNHIDVARARAVEKELAHINILLNGLNGASLDQNI